MWRRNRNGRATSKTVNPPPIAGKRTAIVINKIGLQPHRASQTPRANLAKSTTSPRSRSSSTDATVLYEWRCNTDSKLCMIWKKKGELLFGAGFLDATSPGTTRSRRWRGRWGRSCGTGKARGSTLLANARRGLRDDGFT